MTETGLAGALGIPGDEDRSLSVALDDAARPLLIEGHLDHLEPCLDLILELDLTGLADASLLVASLLLRARRSRPDLDRATQLARCAHDAFVETGDNIGLTLSCLLLGHIAWWGGDAVEAERWWDDAAGLPVEGAVPPGLAPLRVINELMVDGRFKKIVDESHVAYAVTVAEGSVLDEANATLFRGLLSIDTGELDRAVETLERADDLFDEVVPARDAAFWPGVALGLAEVAAWRGDIPLALAQYAVAERRADEIDRPGLAKVARALPVLTLRGQRHVDLLQQAEQAEEALRVDDSHWYLRQLAERALATAYLEGGDAVRCLEIAEALVESARNSMLRAKSQMIVARARRSLALDGAAEALDDAVETFLAEGADLWAVEALLEQAETRPSDAPDSLSLAYARTHDDPAFHRLWRTRPPITIEIVAGRRPLFVVDAVALALGAKGERLAEVVVRAGDGGVHWETVARALWPNEDDPDRIKSRLTSLTALVRRRLGPDGWRLRRQGPLFSFVTLAGDVVVRSD